MGQEVMNEPIQAGQKVTLDFRTNRRVVITDPASGLKVEFTAIVGQECTITAGTTGLMVELFDADSDVAVGEVRLADYPDAT